MTRIIWIVLALGMVSVLYGGATPFQDVGATARAKAMGSAIFADFDGVVSMSYNPATIALSRSLQFYGAWDNPYIGLNDGTSINSFNASIVIPFWNKFTIPPDTIFTKRAAFGFSFHRMGLGGTDADGSSLEFYHEGVYSFFYAKDLNDVISRGAKISIGAKLSLYDIGIGNSIDVQNNANISQFNNLSFGMDLGMTYDFSETIRIGLTYKNLIAPNISILAGGKDLLPGELWLGANWDIGDLFSILKKSKLGFGVVQYFRDASDGRKPDSDWNVGYEFRQLTAEDLFKNPGLKGEMLAVRLGLNYQARSIGEQVNLGIVTLTGNFNLTGGIGLQIIVGNFHLINLDYTVEYGLNMSAFRQYVGLTYELLLQNSAFAYRDDIRKELEFEESLKLKQQGQPTTNTAVTLDSNLVVITNAKGGVTTNTLTNFMVPVSGTNEFGAVVTHMLPYAYFTMLSTDKKGAVTTNFYGYPIVNILSTNGKVVMTNWMAYPTVQVISTNIKGQILTNLITMNLPKQTNSTIMTTNTNTSLITNTLSTTNQQPPMDKQKKKKK